MCVGKKVVGEVPCDGAGERASADFAGASEDGSQVYFKTTASLVAGDTDSGNDLYMAGIGCPEGRSECEVSEKEVTSLVQVSHDPNVGEAADVQGVVRVAPDGRRVYFVAGGDLLSQAQREVLKGQGRPVPRVGAANLYVYDSVSGSVAFIGEGGADEAQTAGLDGRFLVFSTFARLVGSDTDAAKDVYRYDAETGELDRVSLGEEGYGANGNASALGASITQGHNGGSLQFQFEMDNRAISEDGSRIVFTSAEPLSPAASNGLVNAYEWHKEPGESEGKVSLVSAGSAEAPVEDVVISRDGRNVFFVTVQGLVARDTDGAADIYDARLVEGEEVVQSPAEPRPCEGDACQGPLTNPAALLVPGSVSQAPGGNFAAPVSKHAVKPKKKVKKGHSKKGKGKRGKASGRSSRPERATVRSK